MCVCISLCVCVLVCMAVYAVCMNQAKNFNNFARFAANEF